MTVDEFFAGHEDAREIFDHLRRLIESLGPITLRVTKSQVAFRRRTAFAWAWMPAMYLDEANAPLVVTIALRHRDPSPRWKEVVEPRPGRFTHHLELRATAEIDTQVQRWLEDAWKAAL